jgi:hypothetical protein
MVGAQPHDIIVGCDLRRLKLRQPISSELANGVKSFLVSTFHFHLYAVHALLLPCYILLQLRNFRRILTQNRLR